MKRRFWRSSSSNASMAGFYEEEAHWNEYRKRRRGNMQNLGEI
jgi:hypothetical protein